MIKEILKKLLIWIPIPVTKNHKYDIQTKKIIGRLPKNANTIDVGCHKGEIMDLLLHTAPNGKHFGVEPIPEQFKYLTEKYQDKDNVSLLNIAASDEKSESTFNHVVSNPAYSGLRRRDYDNPDEKDETIIVQTDRLDDRIKLDIPIHFIKIDVEGAELQVLKGTEGIIKKHKPIVVFEHGMGASNHYGTTPTDVYTFFEKVGMKISTMTNYLGGKDAFTLQAFEEQYHKAKNYYFIAYG